MAGNSYLVLDIETVIDKDLWTPPPENPDVFPPQYAHRVIAAGVLWLNPDYGFRRMGIMGEGRDEVRILRDLCSFVEKNRPILVTYNGRTFDLPVISLRALKHGVPMSWYFTGRGYRYRFSEEGHYDLMDQLSDYGAARGASLDVMCRLMGLPGKLETSGGDVGKLYEKGEMDRIETYCLQDVIQTAFLFLRHRLLTGAVDEKIYNGACRKLYTAVQDDGRFESIIEGINTEAVFLEGKGESP